MFICGSGSFGHQEKSPCTTPKRSKKSTNFCKIIGKDQGNKNLYSNQGLDTFNALLADLEDKKQQIYSQMGPDYISLVRFVYTNDSKHAKPIVVKVKEKNTQYMNSPRDTTMSPTGVTKTVNVTRDVTQLYSKELEDLLSPVHGEETRDKNGTRKIVMRCNNGSLKLHDLRQPRYYFPMVIVLVVLFLTIFERSFAILCTSILWYLIPMMGESSSSSGSKLKTLKKEHVKNENEKKIVKSKGLSSPTNALKRLTNHKNEEHGRFRRCLVKTSHV